MGGSLLGIAAVALGLVLTPGPNMIYLVSRSIVQGRKAGLVSLLGVGAGFLVYLAAATAGIATVFVLVPPLYTGDQARRRRLPALARVEGGAAGWRVRLRAARAAGRPAAAAVRDGLVTNLLEPKIAILYVSLLPQFVDPARGHVAEQTFLLGVTQIAVALTMNAVIVLSAGTVAGFLGRRPGWLRAQRYVMGSALGGLAVKIAAERRAAAVTP